jgi:curved DNA-binding protein CbpA
VEVPDALAALELGPGATWSEVRARYRLLLRANHPDLTDEPGAADRTARLTAAYAVLQSATGNGRRPLPPAPPPPHQRPRSARAGAGRRPQATRRSGEPQSADDHTGSTGAVIDRRSPTEVFRRLRAAAPAVGSISGVDPESLTLQILVDSPGAAASQLLAEVSRRGPDTAIMFTLESLTAAPGPPIDAVVKRLLAAL